MALTHLNVSHNGFGYHGSLAIEKLLKVNTVLKYLDISNNRITWDAVVLICKGIKVNETLETLKVSTNKLIGDVRKVLPFLTHNGSQMEGKCVAFF